MPLTRAPDRAADAAPHASVVLDALPAAVFVTDAAGLIQFQNAAALRGYGRSELISNALAELRPGDDFRGWGAELNDVAHGGQARSFHATGIRGSRTSAGEDASLPRLYSILLAPLSATGKVVVQIVEGPMLGSCDDRGDLARRLTSLGKMAARVAHELNNPLDGILRYTNMALRLAGDMSEPRIKSYLHESRTGLLRMIEIIGDLLEYSRATAGTFDELGVNEVVEQAIRASADRAAGSGVIITADFQTMQMPGIRGGRLYQVCCNLIRNAIDAMPDGGRLTITTGVVDPDVVLRFADTGVGLPDPASRIFEPFYTTKPAGKGTGLGLAICKDFVEGLGGTLLAESGESRGAIFTIRIPLARCAPPAPARFSKEPGLEAS